MSKLFGTGFIVLALTLTSVSNIEAQSCSAQCGPSGMGGKLCNGYLLNPCPVPGLPTTVIVYTLPQVAASALCTAGTPSDLKFTVSHAPGYGPNNGTQASCSVLFRWYCSSTATTPAMTTNSMGCSVEVTDGLPVELMEFSLK